MREYESSYRGGDQGDASGGHKPGIEALQNHAGHDVVEPTQVVIPAPEPNPLEPTYVNLDSVVYRGRFAPEKMTTRRGILGLFTWRKNQ